MSSWDKVNGKKDKKSSEERDAEIGNWISAQQKVEVSPINLVVYGWDGTGKTSVCMDIREKGEEEKKIFIIDVDGSATPIHCHYFHNDPNIIIVDPIELSEAGDVDWVASYNRILDVVKYIRRHEATLNLKGVVLDGLDTFLKICEMRMRIEDLKINPNVRITDMFSWYLRNSAFLIVVKLIKGLKCDRLFTTHLKETKGFVSGSSGGKTLATTGEVPIWENTFPNLVFQKLEMARIETKTKVELTAVVKKCKTNSGLEGKKYTVLTVDHKTDPAATSWNGIREFLKECR